MLRIDEYRQVGPYSYHGKMGDTQDGMSFKVGDRVIDDRGRVGVVASINSWERCADGSLSNYAICIRYPWNSDAYGLERVATMGEFSLVDESGNPTVDC